MDCESIKWVTTCSGALLEKLIVPHQVKKFTPFYGAWGFITLVTTVPLVLFWARLIQSTPILFLLWWILWLSSHLCIDLPGVFFCQFPYLNPVCISDLPHKCIWRHFSIKSQQSLCTKQPLNFSMSCSQNHYVSLVSNKYGKLTPLGDVDFVSPFCRWFNYHSVLADTSMPGVSNIQTVGHIWCTRVLYMALSLTLLQLQKWPMAVLKYLINFNGAFPLYWLQ